VAQRRGLDALGVRVRHVVGIHVIFVLDVLHEAVNVLSSHERGVVF